MIEALKVLADIVELVKGGFIFALWLWCECCLHGQFLFVLFKFCCPRILWKLSFLFFSFLFFFMDIEYQCINQLHLEVSNGRVGLKLRMLKWVEIEIELGYDPPKLTLGSNGLGSNGLPFGLGHDPLHLPHSISIILTYYYLSFIITIWILTQKKRL